MIARALIQSPQILLADEPITGLDVLASQQVMQILAELNSDQGLTIYYYSFTPFEHSRRISPKSYRFRCWTYSL